MGQVWFRIFLKFVSLTAFVLAIVVIAVSSLTIVGILRGGTAAHDIQEQKNEGSVADDLNTLPSNIEEKESHWKYKVLPKFGNHIKGEYKKVIIGCLITTICAGILQLISSLSIVLSCSKDVRKKILCWLIASLIVFLILIVCFSLPLAYDAKHGHRLDFHEISARVKGHFHKLIKEKSFLENMTHELNSYYIAVGINEAILFIFLILLATCYCMKCGEYNYHPIN